jgi:hypothetical protein
MVRRVLVIALIATAAAAAGQSIPAQLEDDEFWKIITDFSEPRGDLMKLLRITA